MELGLKDKSVIVTGASKGIGNAIAHAFVREGANVTLSARNAQELQSAVDAMKGHAGTALAVPGDVTKDADRTNLVQTAVDRFGTVDVLVNNAGGGVFAAYEDLTLDDWRALFELNVFSVVAISQLVLPYMRMQKSGRIINISSESAVQPDALMPHYNASKAALNSITKSLSKHVGADGILVNTVSPAFIKTPLLEQILANIARERGITPAQAEAAFLRENRPNIVLKRSGTPEETADAVVFIASARASFITGSILRVDGGSVASVGL